jgi:hypothetical protein
MYYENYYIDFSPHLNISSISTYNKIMIKFINNYTTYYNKQYNNKKELLEDSIIYSKYYVYYKIMNCIYNDKIMEILYNIDYIINNHHHC